jgi:hypothetical protein
MSGFVSFLESPVGTATATATLPAPPPELKVTLGPAERRSRIRKADTVEDGHSLAEQAVYTALWKAAVPVHEGIHADRQIRIGYHRLAQMTRLSWVSVKANLRSLEKKLALEVTNCENSAIQQGKGYLVYSPGAILERRRQAGLEWVRRTRGVELLNRSEVI